MPITAVVLLASSIVLAVFLVVMAFSFASRATQLRHQERMRMIEKGITPPPPPVQGWPGVRAQEQQLRFEERRLMIEKGLPLPECSPGQAKDYLRGGIITLCLGIGGGIAYVLVGTVPISDAPLVRAWIAVLSPVLALYGIGCLVYYGIAGKRAPGREPR